MERLQLSPHSAALTCAVLALGVGVVTVGGVAASAVGRGVALPPAGIPGGLLPPCQASSIKRSSEHTLSALRESAFILSAAIRYDRPNRLHWPRTTWADPSQVHDTRETE